MNQRVARMDTRFNQTLYLVVTRFCCPFSVALAFLIAYDLVMPAPYADTCIVQEKSRRRTENGYNHYLSLDGRQSHFKKVSSTTYGRINAGDTVRIRSSRFFETWKRLELIRDSRIILADDNQDLVFMGLVGVLFLASAAAYLPARLIFSNIVLLVTILVVDFAAVLTWASLLQSWAARTGHV